MRGLDGGESPVEQRLDERGNQRLGRRRSTGDSPIFYAAVLVGLFLLRGILTFTSSYFLAWVSNRVVLDLRAAMFSRLVRLPTRFFDDNSSGVLLSKIAYDVMGVTMAATSVITVAVKDSIAVAGLLAWLFYLNWKLTLIALAVGPLIAWSVRLVSRRLRRMAREAQRSMGDLAHVLEETIECHRVVKVFGGQERSEEHTSELQSPCNLVCRLLLEKKKKQ